MLAPQSREFSKQGHVSFWNSVTAMQSLSTAETEVMTAARISAGTVTCGGLFCRLAAGMGEILEGSDQFEVKTKELVKKEEKMGRRTLDCDKKEARQVLKLTGDCCKFV